MYCRLKRLMVFGICGLSTVALVTASAQGLDETGYQAGSESVLVVTGKRASLVSAQGIKQENLQIVDSIVASDIDKLPDISVTDALSRVTGVQIQRDRGEGAGVAIRGLTQMETLLNGREVFTAGWGRNLDFADLPAEMLAGIDVYKTSSAEHVEGGIGGTVDLRMRRPFDFGGREAVASARMVHSDLVNKSAPQVFALLSDRWQTSEGGQFGALFNFAWQQRYWREDQKSAGTPVARTDILAGQTVIAPKGVTENVSLGSRERTSVGMVLEWAPHESLSLYAEANHAEFFTVQDTYQFYTASPTTFSAGSAVLFPNSNDLQSITWTNVGASTVGAARDTLDRTTQIAVGGEWSASESLTLKSDLSYTKSHNDLMYSAIPLGGAQVTLTQDLSGGLPTSQVTAGDLSSTAGFTSAGIWYASRPFDGELTAATLDADYLIEDAFVQKLSTGLRIADRHATDAPGQVGFYPATVAASNAAGIVVDHPYGDYIVGDPAVARNVSATCAALSISCAIPARNDLGTWNIAEQTQSAYAMAGFGQSALDGNAGLRLVRTRESVSGYQSVSGGVAQIDTTDEYTDVLPSLNLRYQLASGLYLRGAASKTLTRQDFNQLSPSLTLNSVQLSGSAGNPALKPVRADNIDLAVERYFSADTSLHATAFWKRVDGFLTTVSNPETHGGITYQVSRPQNSTAADIKGAEIGYQQFYDFLPGWMSGLGLQANYTYVDSGMNNALLGQSVPLQNLSPHSYNIVGMYEREKLSVRVGYNWRDRFLSGVANVVGVGALPIYTAAYGWLDASVTYRFGKELTLTLEGSNLLRMQRRSYYGVETRPQSSWVNDRQVGVSLTARF